MKLRRKLSLMVVGIILAVIMIACGSESTSNEEGNGEANNNSQTDDEVITLKIADYNPPTGFWHKNVVEPFTEEVTERTNGRVEFDVYPGGQLGDSSESLDLVRKGTADLSVIVTSFFESNMPLSSVVSVPGVVESHGTTTLALNDILFEEDSLLMENDYLNNDIYPMIVMTLPENNIFVKGDPVRKPEDLKGLDMRSSSSANAQAFEDLGAVSVNIPTTEAYHSIDTGVVDGTAVPFTAVESFRLDEVVDTGSNVSFGSIIGTLVMGSEVWESLPEDIQDIFNEVREELTPIINQAYVDETARILEEFKAENEYVELTEEEQEEWASYWEEFQDLWVESSKANRDLPYDDLINQLKEKSEEYE